MEGHPTIHLRSMVPGINTQSDIGDVFDLPFTPSFWNMYQLKTSPWELIDKNFEIVPEKIDRLYYLCSHVIFPKLRNWEICFRMEYNSELYFVEMYATCDYLEPWFDSWGSGYVYIIC